MTPVRQGFAGGLKARDENEPELLMLSSAMATGSLIHVNFESIQRRSIEEIKLSQLGGSDKMIVAGKNCANDFGEFVSALTGGATVVADNRKIIKSSKGCFRSN